MDCIVISDEESSNRKKGIVQNFGLTLTNNNDELIALELEIKEIGQQVNRLRKQRARLVKRQKALKQEIQQNPQIVTDTNEQWKRRDFPWSAKLIEMRNEIFHINSFRSWQLETINVTLSGLDCILIMPTGGGKSLCYQLPAVISDGITVVVSPLISLVEDQMYALRNLNIDARSLNTSTSREEQSEILRILDGQNKYGSTLKILYLTPEKIAKNKRIMAKLQKLYQAGQFSKLIIDEIHCVSQFGHDFRPDYKYLSIFKRQFPKISILGLTATATLKVIDDIRKILQIPRCVLFRAPFNRKNLFYELYHKPNTGKDALNELAKCIRTRFDQQSGIVYCLSQKDAEDVCSDLLQRDIKAGCYHAGLSASARTEVHGKWLENEVHVICATIAFGMGIDKPDVRFVIHYSLSKSIENFYQESGRAGRDDQQSYCILFFRFADVFRLAPMAFSDKSGHGLTNLYSMITYCLNESQCRRIFIAKYFDEVWQSNDCNEMCDACKRLSSSTASTAKRNCREEASIIINYLSNIKKERITALQLMDKLAITTMTKLNLQRLILQMIIDQYLKEHFHFTAYSTICYIQLGPRATSITNEDCQILLDMVDTVKKTRTIATRTATKSSTTTTRQRAKLNSVTNLNPFVQPSKRKVRTLQYDDDDDDDEDENQPKLKKSTIQ